MHPGTKRWPRGPGMEIHRLRDADPCRRRCLACGRLLTVCRPLSAGLIGWLICEDPMQHLLSDLQADAEAVEAYMADALSCDEPRVARLIEELGEFHGKMLRPTLCLMVAQAAETDVTSQHHCLGAALELIHTATLIHDDMIDDGMQRRGKPTAHVRFGLSTAVLLGDFFYTHAFHLVSRLGQAWLMQRLTECTNVLCAGELQQMCASGDVALTEDEYERIIYAKTAALTEVAAELGCLDRPDLRDAAREFGRACGMAFQIVDDILDLSGDPEKVGKTLSTDIERGRLTLPFIRMLARFKGDERHQLAQQLQQVQGEEDVATIRQVVIDRGGVASAKRVAVSYVQQALQALAAFPEGPGRDRLAALASFIVARDF